MANKKLVTVLGLLCFPIVSFAYQGSQISIQVFVEGEPRTALVNVNGIGYLIRTSPMVTPNQPIPLPEPSQPVNPNPVPQPQPVTPNPPSIPTKGTLERFAYDYIRSMPISYKNVHDSIKSGLVEKHKDALKLNFEPRETRRKEFSGEFDRELMKCLDTKDLNTIADRNRYAEVWMRAYQGFVSGLYP